MFLTVGITNGTNNAGHQVAAIKKRGIYNSNFACAYVSVGTNPPVWTIQPAVNFDTVVSNDYAWFVAKGPPNWNDTNHPGGELLYRRLHWTSSTNVTWVDSNWLSDAATNSVTNWTFWTVQEIAAPGDPLASFPWATIIAALKPNP